MYLLLYSLSGGTLSLCGHPERLRWWGYSPVTWPVPSHPGVGHFTSFFSDLDPSMMKAEQEGGSRTQMYIKVSCLKLLFESFNSNAVEFISCSSMPWKCRMCFWNASAIHIAQLEESMSQSSESNIAQCLQSFSQSPNSVVPCDNCRIWIHNLQVTSKTHKNKSTTGLIRIKYVSLRVLES